MTKAGVTKASSKKRSKARIAGSALLSIFLVLILFFCAKYAYHAFLLRRNPIPYESEILSLSEEYGIEVSRIYAIVKTESNFDPEAVSFAGAVGLMQIMPETANWLSAKFEELPSEFNLTDPMTNLRFGCCYLRHLYNAFGDWEAAEAAYNAGPTRVRAWMQDEAIYRDGAFYSIPFPETENYLQKIRENMKIYDELYAEKGW